MGTILQEEEKIKNELRYRRGLAKLDRSAKRKPKCSSISELLKRNQFKWETSKKRKKRWKVQKLEKLQCWCCLRKESKNQNKAEKCVRGERKKLKDACGWHSKSQKMPVTFLESDPALGAMIFVSYFCYERIFWYLQEMNFLVRLNIYIIKS